MRIAWTSFLIPTLVIAIAWLALSERLPAWFVGTAHEIAVNVVRVQKRMLPVTIRSDGRLKLAKESEVFTRLAGRISELRFKVGEFVVAGTVVAVIYSSEIAQRQTELEAQVAVALKELKQKESELAAAESLAGQRRDLFKQDLIARREFEQAEAAAQTARAGAELARAHWSQQESMLAQTRKIGSLTQITAPLGGVVTQRLVDVGAMVGTATPIMTIASDRSLKFSGTVSSRFASELKPGLNATISSPAASGKTFDGVLRNVTPSVENDGVVLDIEIHIEKNAPELTDGIAARALVYLNRQEPVFLLPRAAIFESGSKSYVFKIVAEHALRQEVILGAMVNGEIVIGRGISENDLVIVGPRLPIAPGSRVRPMIKQPVAH